MTLFSGSMIPPLLELMSFAILVSGSGAPNKKPNAVRRAQLERKLQSKMDKFTEQRKPKEKDKS